MDTSKSSANRRDPRSSVLCGADHLFYYLYHTRYAEPRSLRLESIQMSKFRHESRHSWAETKLLFDVFV